MATREDFVKLALDSRNNRGDATKYSKQDSQAALREALIEMNGGSTKIDARSMRSGRAAEMYAVVEEVIQTSINDYWTNNEIVNMIVDYRNIALGDVATFWIPDDDLFAVATVSEGNMGIRRQRLEGGRRVTVETQLRAVKIYEEMLRVMANRVDFNTLIDRAIDSMNKDAYERMIAAWAAIGATDLGEVYVPTVTGSYDEEQLLDLIAHVEAETGENAVIYGTKKALRNLAPATGYVASSAKEDLYTMGYFGKFYGTDCVCLRQSHKLNSTDFVLDDKTLYVMSASDKPVKYVTEGEGMVIAGDPYINGDLTYEWTYAERTGVAVVLNKKYGKYVMP